MNKFCLLLALATVAGCGDRGDDGATPASNPMTDAATTDNPLLQEWHTPFGTPPFARIESTQYLPAYRAAIAAEQAEIEAIAASAEAPTFANTIEALERSGRLLTKVDNVFDAVNSANSDEVTKATAREIAPALSARYDDIYLNKALFGRVHAVFEQRAALDLNDEQQRLLEETHREFVRAGANLGPESQSRLRSINAELATLSEKFAENLLNETNDFELLVTDAADLGKLPPNLVELAAAEATRRGHDCACWSFTLQRPSINPFLQYSPNRELRKTLFEGYALRGNNGNAADNKDVVARTVELRAYRAALMGYDSFADYVLEDRMAENTSRVYALLDQVWQPAIAAAKRERADLQALLHADGVTGKLQAWDWRYYTEKLRTARYDFDEEALRPYFEVNAVRDGVFELAHRLFGLSFERREDLPGWHPQQQVFEVFDADGSHLAVLYMDFFARPSKNGGAWMNALRVQSKQDGKVSPIVTNNFNFPAPTANSPSLLSLSEAETVFHEFGHALHGMFSDVTYESLAGTSTPRDFVEFPSQVMENWMREPEVLRMFARHYETGAEIPADIIEKITASAKFNQGFMTVEYLAASYLDMAYHVLGAGVSVEPNVFEAKVLSDIGLIDEIIPRYRSTYFKHIFNNTYSAGYYSYLWSEVLDADTFLAFKETSLLSRATAARYREQILSKGSTRPGMELYLNFRGREPQVDALLTRRGFE